MKKSKKIIDLAKQEFGERSGAVFIGGKDRYDDAPALKEQVADEDAELSAAIRYNENIEKHAERYLRLKPVQSGLVLVRHYLHVPKQGKLVRPMPRINVVDDSKPMNKKVLTIADPFPFTGQAVVVLAHPDTGLQAGDLVIVTPPHKVVTLHHVGFDGLFIAPGGDPDGALSYTGDTSDYGYRIVSNRDILFKVKP